jgi:uncharacterized membrane protein YfcA
MNPIEILVLTTIITFIGSVLQASVGYGFGLVVVPLLVLINPEFVPVPLLLVSLVLMFYVSYKNRFSLKGHNILYLIIGLGVGAPIGAFILSQLNGDLFIYLICFLVIIGLIVSFLKIKVPIIPTTQLGAGITANIFGTSAGIGGVPIALLYQYESSAKIRAVLSTTFLIGSLFSILSLIISDQVSYEAIRLSGYLLPGVLIGGLLGNSLVKYINKAFSRILILLLSGVGVIFLIFRVTNATV